MLPKAIKKIAKSPPPPHLALTKCTTLLLGALFLQDSGMIWRNAAVAMGAADAWEYKIYVCSQSKVRAVVDTLGHLIIS